MDLSLPELDLLLTKVTAGDQTPATMALADRIRDAQDSATIRSNLHSDSVFSNAAREAR